MGSQSDTTTVYDVVFVVEATATLGNYLNLLKDNYILPALKYFHGGPPADLDYGCNYGCSLYGLVLYHGVDSFPDVSARIIPPTSSTKKILDTLMTLDYSAGGGDASSFLAEGLAAALQIFEALRRGRQAQVTVERVCLVLSNSEPNSLPCQDPNYTGCSCEQLLNKLIEAQVNVCLVSPRKLPVLTALFTKVMSEAQLSKKYAVDSHHLVLLQGLNLEEQDGLSLPVQILLTLIQLLRDKRPPSPVASKKEEPIEPVTVSSVRTTNGQTTTTQSDASFKVPQSQLPIVSPANVQPILEVAHADQQRRTIWQGMLEWSDKARTPTDMKVTRSLQCCMQMQSSEIEVNASSWPNKLLMQLLPQHVLQSLQPMFRQSRTLIITFSNGDVDSAKYLVQSMSTGLAGCINIPSTVPSEVRIVLLLYSQRRRQLMGLIPNDQARFIHCIKQIYMQRKPQPSRILQPQMGQQPMQGQGFPMDQQQQVMQQAMNMPQQQQVQMMNMNMQQRPNILEEQQFFKMQGGVPASALPANQVAYPGHGVSQATGLVPHAGGQVQPHTLQSIHPSPNIQTADGRRYAGGALPQGLGGQPNQQQLRHLLMQQRQQQQQQQQMMMHQQQQQQLRQSGMMRGAHNMNPVFDEFTFDG